jgi:hypothetical protein
MPHQVTCYEGTTFVCRTESLALLGPYLLEGVAKVDVHQPRRALLHQDVGCVPVANAQDIPAR